MSTYHPLMRMGWSTCAALVVVALTGAACGGDDGAEAENPATTTSIVVASTTVPAATSSSSTPATTVVRRTTTTAATTTSVAEDAPGPAELALVEFLAAYEALAAQLEDVTARVESEIDDTGAVSPALVDETDAAGSAVFQLVRLVPAGLEPELRRAVHDAVFTMGEAAAAYLFAPGWSAEDWPEWADGMEAARAQLPTMQERVEDRAADHPELTAVVPGSREDAAGAVLPLQLIRTFGHGGPDQEVGSTPAAVRWIGALPEGAVDGSACSLDPVTFAPFVPTGDFVDGVGGCAVVFYDGNASSHEAEIAAWQADPTQLPSGEFVAFVYRDAMWSALGSVE